MALSDRIRSSGRQQIPDPQLRAASCWSLRIRSSGSPWFFLREKEMRLRGLRGLRRLSGKECSQPSGRRVSSTSARRLRMDAWQQGPQPRHGDKKETRKRQDTTNDKLHSETNAGCPNHMLHVAMACQPEGWSG
jgi:hypothetical protein